MAPTIPKKMPSKVSEISKEVHIYHYNITNKKSKSLLEEIKKIKQKFTAFIFSEELYIATRFGCW